MTGWKRKRVTIDFPLQGSFCLRITGYWVSCLCIVGTISAMRLSLIDSQIGRDWGTEYGRILLFSIIALPLALLDGLIYSNRFAGPMYRFRTELKKLANGEKARRIKLRPGDFYADAAADLNTLIDKMEVLSKNEPTAATEPTNLSERCSDRHELKTVAL